MTYTTEGQKYSVVMLSHPQNPSGTAWSAYRNYGRFGAFYKTAIKQNETLKIQARFVVTKAIFPAPRRSRRSGMAMRARTSRSQVAPAHPPSSPLLKSNPLPATKE